MNQVQKLWQSIPALLPLTLLPAFRVPYSWVTMDPAEKTQIDFDIIDYLIQYAVLL
jgi:hypothetical protein